MWRLGWRDLLTFLFSAPPSREGRRDRLADMLAANLAHVVVERNALQLRVEALERELRRLAARDRAVATVGRN
jgi:hypothetical protein